MSSKIYIVGPIGVNSKYATNMEELKRLVYEQYNPKYLTFDEIHFVIDNERVSLLDLDRNLEATRYFHTLERMQ